MKRYLSIDLVRKGVPELADIQTRVLDAALNQNSSEITLLDYTQFLRNKQLIESQPVLLTILLN